MTTLSDAPTHTGISLRDAIADASPEDTVNFQQGLSGTITLTSGPLTINKLLTITGPCASVITVSGNKAQEVFNIPAPFTVTISGLTIANGNATSGGGISASGNLTITDCVISDNSGSYDGGGIWSTGTLTVANSTLSNNSGGGYGGGIINFGTLTVANFTLSGNFATNGGGIINDAYFNPVTLTVTNSTLSGNSATSGGGIYNGLNGSGTLAVTNSTLSSNS